MMKVTLDLSYSYRQTIDHILWTKDTTMKILLLEVTIMRIYYLKRGLGVVFDFSPPKPYPKRQFHKRKSTVKLAVSVKVGVSVRVLVLMVRVQLA